MCLRGPLLAAKNGLGGPLLAAKIGLGWDHFWQGGTTFGCQKWSRVLGGTTFGMTVPPPTRTVFTGEYCPPLVNILSPHELQQNG